MTDFFIYDDEPASGDNAGPAPSDQNRVVQAMQFFVQQGLSPERAAGIVGNLMGESGAGLNPDEWGDNGTSYGVGQWHNERLTSLDQFARAAGTDKGDFQTQLRFLLHELNTTEGRAGEALSQANDPRSAAIAFMHFERPQGYTPDNPAGGLNAAGRQANAMRALQAYAPGAGGMQSPPPVPGPTGPQAAPGQIDPDQAVARLRALAQPAPQAPPSVSDQDQGLQDQLAQLADSNPFQQPFQAKATPIGVAQPQAPAPPALLPAIANATRRNVQQGYGGVQDQIAGVTAGIPSQLAAMMDKLGIGKTNPTQIMAGGMATPDQPITPPQPGPGPMGDLAGWFAEQQGYMHRYGQDVAGNPGEPQNLGEALSAAAGRNANPSALWTGAFTTADLAGQGLNRMFTPAEAATRSQLTPDEINQIMQNRRPAFGGPQVPMNEFGTPLDKDGKPIHIIQTLAGPHKISQGELNTLGIEGAMTVGMALLPLILKRFPTPDPKLRPVEDAPAGTMAMSNLGDLARTADDMHAGWMRLARRAGVDPTAYQTVQDRFQIQTGANAGNLIAAAVNHGEMNTPTISFKVPVSVAELSQRAQDPVYADYLHLRDTYDDINLQEQALRQKSKAVQAQVAAAGPVTVRGLSRIDVLTRINQIEAAQPDVVDVYKAFQQNVRETNRILATGEYALLTPKLASKFRQERPNYVPWMDGEGQRVLGNAQGDRGSPFVALQNYMQDKLRARFTNEANGMYHDMMMDSPFVQAGDARGEHLYNEIPRADFADTMKNNPNWRNQMIDIRRRGKPSYYAVDPFVADVHHLDPYYNFGTAGNAFYAVKKFVETNTTGLLAPYFAVTSGVRNHFITAMSPDAGFKSPHWFQSLWAIPEQLAPQMARYLGDRIDASGYLRANWPQQAQALTDALAQRLHNTYNQSLFAQLERAGGTHSSFLQNQVEVRDGLSKFVKQSVSHTPGLGTLASGYAKTLNALHSAANFAYARRNFGKVDIATLAMKGRDVTGDPRISGRHFNAQGQPIRYQVRNTAEAIAKGGVDLHGYSQELARQVLPWYNITLQGMKRLGDAYWRDPVRFMGRVWMYAQMPAAMGYMYAKTLDQICPSPDGRSYVDYMMNRRSSYARTMFQYLPIPGRPPEAGMELPIRIHELSIFSRVMEDALHHMYGQALFPENEDFAHGLASWIGVVLPSAPSWITGPAAALGGVVLPSGYGGEAFTPRADPLDPNSTMSKYELFARAIAPGSADILANMHAAASHTDTDEEGYLKAAANALKAGGRRVVEKTPMVRNVLDMTPPMVGTNDITEELFAKRKSIDGLIDFMKKYDSLSTKSKTVGGGQLVDSVLGPAPEGNVPGKISHARDIPEPTNPLYSYFIQQVYNKFNRDTPLDKGVFKPETGGIGMQSAWQRYGLYSKLIADTRSVNEGNAVTWQERLPADVYQALSDHGVDPMNVRDARSWFENQRQDAARLLLFTIKEVEDQMSQDLGQPIKLENLKPYQRPDPTMMGPGLMMRSGMAPGPM